VPGVNVQVNVNDAIDAGNRVMQRIDAMLASVAESRIALPPAHGEREPRTAQFPLLSSQELPRKNRRECADLAVAVGLR
jgi:hypothetical protein